MGIVPLHEYAVERFPCVDLYEAYIYLVKFDDPSRPTGAAGVELREFGDDFSLDESLAENGLVEGDIALLINGFYPTSGTHDRSYPEYERQGVGSRLLRVILDDAVDFGASVVRVLTAREKMRRFLTEKHDFERWRDGYVYYMFLG